MLKYIEDKYRTCCILNRCLAGCVVNTVGTFYFSVHKYVRIYQPNYVNTPILYTVIFHGCKNDYFHMKNCDIFLIFAQNIDRGYTIYVLEQK